MSRTARDASAGLNATPRPTGGAESPRTGSKPGAAQRGRSGKSKGPTEAVLAGAPLDPLCSDFLLHLNVQRRLAERTRSMYRDALVRLQRFAATEDRTLPAVLPHHVRHWAAQLHGQGLSPRSIAIHLAAWRGLYRHLGREGLVPINPVDGIRPPKNARPLPKALSVEHAVALAEHTDAPGSGRDPVLDARDHAIVELLYGCGLRVAELCGLDAQASDSALGWLDLQSGDAHVLGKGSKRRSVPIGQAALKAVAHWLSVRAALAKPEETALFVGRRGTRLGDAQVRKRLSERALQAGLPSHVHPHMLRHSYASHLLQSSGDLRAVQELLGHAQITSTQVYTRLDFQHLAKVYDAAHPRAKRKP